MGKPIPQFMAKIENGRMIMPDNEKKKLSQYLETLKGDIVVKIDKKFNKRTLNQNRLYWYWITKIAEHYFGSCTEREKNQIHAYFKDMFLSRDEVVNKKRIKVVRSTTELDSYDFSNYLEKVNMHSALSPDDGGFGMVLPMTYE